MKTKSKWCGACLAGIVVSNGNEIQRCDDCGIYRDDIAAARTVLRMLKLLHREWNRTEAPTAAMRRLERR